jgi:hypothetical protein
MARTASMTAAEAEAAIGRRGQIAVTAENRGSVRKWFVAQGLPALFVGGLSMRELALAYNDTKGEQFARLLKKYEEAKNAAGEEVEDHTAEVIQTIETAAAGTNGHANGDAAALLDLLRRTIGSSVDADQVREIVDATIREKADAIAKDLKKLMWPVTRVQLIAPSGETRDVDGPVHPNFPLLLRMAQARDTDGYHINIFLSGEASSGKTTACKLLAKAIDRKWYFNGAISMPHEMLGFIDAAGNYHRTPFRDAYEHGGVYTFDEVDRSDPTALLAINPHLANGVATFPDGQIKRQKGLPDRLHREHVGERRQRRLLRRDQARRGVSVQVPGATLLEYRQVIRDVDRRQREVGAARPGCSREGAGRGAEGHDRRTRRLRAPP